MNAKQRRKEMRQLRRLVARTGFTLPHADSRNPAILKGLLEALREKELRAHGRG